MEEKIKDILDLITINQSAVIETVKLIENVKSQKIDELMSKLGPEIQNFTLSDYDKNTINNKIRAQKTKNLKKEEIIAELDKYKNNNNRNNLNGEIWIMELLLNPIKEFQKIYINEIIDYKYDTNETITLKKYIIHNVKKIIIREVLEDEYNIEIEKQKNTIIDKIVQVVNKYSSHRIKDETMYNNLREVVVLPPLAINTLVNRFNEKKLTNITVQKKFIKGILDCWEKKMINDRYKNEETKSCIPFNAHFRYLDFLSKEKNALDEWLRNVICSGNHELVNKLDNNEYEDTNKLENYKNFLSNFKVHSQRDDGDLRIISFNCEKKKQDMTYFNSFFKNIVLNRFDIICLQEFSRKNLKKFFVNLNLENVYSYRQECIIINNGTLKGNYDITKRNELFHNQICSSLMIELKLINTDNKFYISNAHLPYEDGVQLSKFNNILNQLNHSIIDNTLFFGDYNLEVEKTELLNTFKDKNFLYQEIKDDQSEQSEDDQSEQSEENKWEKFNYTHTNSKLDMFYDVVNVGKNFKQNRTFQNGCIVVPFAKYLHLFAPTGKNPLISDHFPVYLVVRDFFAEVQVNNDNGGGGE